MGAMLMKMATLHKENALRVKKSLAKKSYKEAAYIL